MHPVSVIVLFALLLALMLIFMWIVGEAKAEPRLRRCAGALAMLLLISAALLSFACGRFTGAAHATLAASGAAIEFFEGARTAFEAGDVQAVRDAVAQFDLEYEAYEHRLFVRHLEKASRPLKKEEPEAGP